MIDLGFIGNRFTWNHGVHIETRNSTRLNRGLCNDERRRFFPSAIVNHLTHS